MSDDNGKCPACTYESSGGSRAEHRIGSPPGSNPPGPCITYFSGSQRDDYIVPKEDIVHYLQGAESAYCESHMSKAIKHELNHLSRLELKIDHAAGTITMKSKDPEESDVTITFEDTVDQLTGV